MRYRTSSLWNGVVGAWCPSMTAYGGFTLPDLSGLGNHGQLNNMDPGTDYVANGDGVALDFDSTNDNVTFPIFNASFETPCASLNVWLKLNAATPASETNTGFIQTKTPSSGTASHYVWTNGQAYLHTFRSARVDGITLRSDVTRTDWHNVTITTDGQTWSMYQNGLLATSTTAESSVTFSASDFNVGLTSGGGFNYYLNGMLDDLIIWTRCLTPSEIAQLSSRRRAAYATLPDRVYRRQTTSTNYMRRKLLLCSS